MTERRRRHSRKYDGTQVTSRHLGDLLPQVLQRIGRIHQERPDLIMAAWPEVIGERLASMTEAVEFTEGVLTVRVKNSTLYSLLTQHDKPRILKQLRSRFPKSTIKNIIFRII